MKGSSTFKGTFIGPVIEWPFNRQNHSKIFLSPLLFKNHFCSSTFAVQHYLLRPHLFQPTSQTLSFPCRSGSAKRSNTWPVILTRMSGPSSTRSRSPRTRSSTTPTGSPLPTSAAFPFNDTLNEEGRKIREIAFTYEKKSCHPRLRAKIRIP